MNIFSLYTSSLESTIRLDRQMNVWKIFWFVCTYAMQLQIHKSSKQITSFISWKKVSMSFQLLGISPKSVHHKNKNLQMKTIATAWQNVDSNINCHLYFIQLFKGLKFKTLKLRDILFGLLMFCTGQNYSNNYLRVAVTKRINI